MRIRYAVHCNKHGLESKDYAGKQVIVAKPKYRKQGRDFGCPYYKLEKEAK